MNIVIFGGTGGTGEQVIMQALALGHKVTAVVRRPEALTQRHEHLVVRQGDVMDPASLVSAFNDQDAVLSALGTGTSRKPTTLYSDGTRNILQAMSTAQVKRFVGVTASGFITDPKDSLLLTLIVKPLISRILKYPYADMKRMEAEVRQSALEWTIVRPARLTDDLQRSSYRTVVGGVGNVPAGTKISRADVADFMVRQLENEHTFRKAVGIAY